MTLGWVFMITAAAACGLKLCGEDESSFFLYYWTATMHLTLLWMLYLTLEHAYPRPHVLSNAQESAHAYSGTATVNPAILLAGQNQTEQCFYVDTGCSISIIKDAAHLHNICCIQPIKVQGVARNWSITQAGNFHFQAADNAGVYCTVIINNVLLDCDSPVNLLSGEQLRLYTTEPLVDQHHTATAVAHADVTTHAMSYFLGNITLEELMHMHMNHANSDKLIEQSKLVDGMPSVLSKPALLRGPCH
eukprot:2501268-Rhodomonas_salina.1